MRKYQSDGGPGMDDILHLLRGSDTSDQNIATFMRACILFWMIGATDGHAKNFSITLGPGGRFRLTPLYDVLTAQPKLDAGQIQQKKFRLAISIGRNRHYPVGVIMPSHLLQTAALAGVGLPVMHTIFEDVAAEAEKATDTIIDALPPGFPDQLVTSVRAGVRSRAAHLANASREAAAVIADGDA